VPKTWFDLQHDVLYFPAKEGWLGSWNHFVNTLTMTAPAELGKVKRLAVSEALFRGVRGASSSPNVQATCVREFWEYVRKKFGNVGEVTILVEKHGVGMMREEVRVWIEGMLGCDLGKDEIGVGSSEERLVEGLERGLRFVEENSEWTAPRWDVLRFPTNGTEPGTTDWPVESLEESSLDVTGWEEAPELLDSIVIPHSKVVARKEEGFWMGGTLPYWHYLAEG
jgi:hypothetical protein